MIKIYQALPLLPLHGIIIARGGGEPGSRLDQVYAALSRCQSDCCREVWSTVDILLEPFMRDLKITSCNSLNYMYDVDTTAGDMQTKVCVAT